MYFECQCNAFCSVYAGSCVLGLPASRSLQSCRLCMIVATCHAIFDFFVRHPHPRARAASFLIAEARKPMCHIGSYAFMLGVYAKDRACTTPRHTTPHTRRMTAHNFVPVFASFVQGAKWLIGGGEQKSARNSWQKESISSKAEFLNSAMNAC